MAGLYTGTGMLFNFSFFFFSFWHSEKEFERTTFYTLSLAVSIGMACSPSRQEGVLTKVNFVSCFKLILNGESC